MIDPNAKTAACCYATLDNLARRVAAIEERHQASLDNLARRLERLENNHQASLATAIELIMACVPVLDLQISEHNDCHRLRRAICYYLAGAGYPGWLSSRGLIADR